MKKASQIIRDLKIQTVDSDSYDINSESIFFHVGNDLGRPEIHVTCEVGCRSQGIIWDPYEGVEVLRAKLIKYAII